MPTYSCVFMSLLLVIYIYALMVVGFKRSFICYISYVYIKCVSVHPLNTVQLLVCYNLTMYVYYVCILRYYVGKMELGVINGPNEGVFICIAFFLLTGIFGQGIWATHKYNLLLGILAVSVLTVR